MERQKISNYEEAVEYLFNIPRFTKKNLMEDTKAFLKRLGNPDKSFRIIHVAGTNGKGSVCAYLRTILEEAGYSVCVFTSPHLVDVRERFFIKGEMVGKEEFLQAFYTVYDRIPWEFLKEGDVFDEEGRLPNGFYHPTFFEYLFFMAMLLFRDAMPDYVILETGLGGLLDATNAVSHKELAVITRIGLDHMEYLGDTPEKIAAQKAGIIAKGAPVVCLDSPGEACAVIVECAEKIGASECIVSKNDYVLSNFRDKNIDFSLHTRYYNDIRLSLHTAALYQVENASLAVRALETLDQGRTVTKEQIQKGAARCFWPGRMEEAAPNLFVDGAHNEDGVRAFLKSVRADAWTGERVLLFSAVRDKQYEKMLWEIVASDLFDGIFLVPMQTGRATRVEVLAELTEKMIAEHSQSGKDKIEVGSFSNVEEALTWFRKNQKEGQRVYVAGSLYLAGEVLALVK